MSHLRFNLDSDRKNVTTNSWYNNAAKILDHTRTLEHFNALINARHRAGYQREERLAGFIVLGRYYLDSAGNCMKAQGRVPKDLIPEMPDVMGYEEFCGCVKAKYGESNDTWITYSHNSDLPSHELKCAECGNQWTIHNCHDTVVHHATEVYPLTEFVYKRLINVRVNFNDKNDANYLIQPDMLIRSDRFIDLSPKYPGDTEEWKKGIVKNERGWVSQRDGIYDDYVIHQGDETYLNIWRFYHGECNKKRLSRNEEKYFKDIFEKAGFQTIQMSALPNGYCPCEHCAPWFEVSTEVGTFKIGWRKRVINLDWSATQKNHYPLFMDEDVTKSEFDIHAWGPEKAIEYLAKIRLASM